MKMQFQLCLFFLLCFSPILKAQQIKGQFLNNQSEKVSDVLVYIGDGQVHSHSQLDGRFTLEKVEIGDTLRTQRLAYESLFYIIQAEDFSQELNFTLATAAIELKQISIRGNVNTFSQIAQVDIASKPINNSQEILRKVPGLMIGQHAGGGKAEQIFLRGFDIDHGTDISINVDGMPVNMVSHAHGQGYADLHFLIPETVDQIDFGKGPYYADQGNFTTAGYVNFSTKDVLERSSIGLEFGQFNHQRLVGLFKLLENQPKQDAYLATEFMLNDGPFESPQQFSRFNIMGKYTARLSNRERLEIGLSHFQSQWNASGQIPQRLVDQGVISRFGSVDDTEGGFTDRTNINLEHSKSISDQLFVKTNAFFSRYNFELYSNFTFFLEDPVNGDQIRQGENRQLFGLQTTFNNRLTNDLELNYGLGFRYDAIDNNELSRSLNRQTTLEQLALGDVDELNVFSFVDAQIEVGNWRFNPGLRLDGFNFNYQDDLQENYTSLADQALKLSPKLNIFYQANPDWQYFLKAGRSFHSNDTRVVVQRETAQTLPAAYGLDLGTVWKPRPNLWLHAALWYLDSEQEFVYVGDAGIVEPSGRSHRKGIDLGMRLQLSPEWMIHSDVNYANARAINEPRGAQYIPLAPDWTSTGGINYRGTQAWSAGLNYRYMNIRPANEDFSIAAQGYFIVDANVAYDFGPLGIGLTVENLFDQDWNEAQFATESRLSQEDESVEEIHFTPGTPFFLKASLQYRF